MKALRLKGYFGNRPNVISAMKLEGWKNLAQDKNMRRDMGLDYDLIMNKPSDAVVANISMLNALPRDEFEGLWREVHGDKSAPTRTGSMEDVENLARVWQLYQERNRRTEIIPGRVFDADTRDRYLEAGIIKARSRKCRRSLRARRRCIRPIWWPPATWPRSGPSTSPM
ncbi:MAG: hypothetical protein HS126_22020 [Anaerolineales bacterium]|nr:hypothetical protein [Anaerolineales bacterium]